MAAKSKSRKEKRIRTHISISEFAMSIIAKRMKRTGVHVSAAVEMLVREADAAQAQ